ncbi:aminotransferase, class I/II [Fusobacterium equinum]|uniref:Aminotransferase n=2 Tax=Fusobacterium equinum TaxID=134605 RepID=A0A133NKV0_9FUSO|nr:aminotransferase, class I/II [Fusobacterium equinum]
MKVWKQLFLIKRKELGGRMLAKHYQGKKLNDEVFATAQRAKAAIDKYGKEAVFNATLGSLYDEEENLVVFDVVRQMFRELPLTEFTAYAPHFTGSAGYKESVKQSVLGEDYEKEYPNYYFSVIGTPGGTGALSNTIKNYLNYGDKVLLPKRMWGPYKAMAKEAGGSFDCYELFDEEGKFHLASFEEKVNLLSEQQENLIVIINDPCQNPTGFKLSREEWLSVMKILKKASNKANIILLKDIAYQDFDTLEYREENILSDLPGNILVVYAFSLSKALGIYGMRAGAQLAVSSKKEWMEEFDTSATFSCRATWSNASRGGMEMFVKIMETPHLKRKLLEEQQKYRDLLLERADIFLREAEECGLEVLPYKSGFFLSVPIGEKVRELITELEKQNIFTIIFDDAIRIAICGLPKRKLKGLAKKIKDTIENIRG